MINSNENIQVINCLKMKDKNTLVSGSSDSSLRIWNIQISNRIKVDGSKSDKLIGNLIDVKVLNGHQSDIYCVDTCGDYIASGGADSLVIIWNFDGDLLYKLNGHLGIVRCIFMDKHKLVTGGDAKKIIVWDYKVKIFL